MSLSVKKLFIISILFSLLSSTLLYLYLNNLEKSKNDSLEKVVVVIAQKDINEGEIIKKEDLGLVRLYKSAIHEKAIRNIEDAVGVVASSNIIKGEVLLSSRLLKGDSSSLSLNYKIPEGMRAATIQINEISGVAGLIEESNKVDLIAVFAKDEKQGTENISYTFMENVTVLAVGTNVKNEKNKQAPISSLTLAVTPEQAEIIAYMELFSKSIKVVLRSEQGVVGENSMK